MTGMIEDLDSPDLLPTAGGLEDVWGSGHVAGPWTAEEIAELEAVAERRGGG